MQLFRSLLTLLTLVGTAVASPIPPRWGATSVSPDVVDAWVDPAFYASVVYCPSSSVKKWSCGSSCVGSPTLEVLATGGDNHLNPLYFVGTNESHTIVSIAGTNPFSPLSIAVDLDFLMVPPSQTDFPQSNGVMVHHGWYAAYQRMIGSIDNAVKTAVNSGHTQVLVVGHSMGGAIGHLVSTHLGRTLGNQATVSARLFASPRVGNQAWANYVDATLGNRAQHMVNFNDPVPQLPPAELGFVQSSNEIWISNAAGNNFISCPGQENPSCQDGLGIVAGVAEFAKYLNLAVHLGPYAGVIISSLTCPLF